MYYVYILTNKSNTLYVGVTNNLLRRVEEHSQKVLEGFTSRYNIDKLIYFQEFSEIEDAITFEKKIKGWRRQKKIQLIKSKNPNFGNLLVNG